MGEGGGDGGGCPSPSVQKPIPFPRAKNQGPSKKILLKTGEKCNFLRKKSLFFVIFARKIQTLTLLKKLLVPFFCFRKIPVSS